MLDTHAPKIKPNKPQVHQAGCGWNGYSGPLLVPYGVKRLYTPPQGRFTECQEQTDREKGQQMNLRAEPGQKFSLKIKNAIYKK